MGKHEAAALLEQLMPGRPDLVEEILLCVQVGVSWKKVC